jgi:hypothetical protein
MIIGNEWDGYAGPVGIVATVSNNRIHDNLETGVIIADEDSESGSFVSVSGKNNVLPNNGDYGYYIHTYGDGDVTVAMSGETITGNGTGINLYDSMPSSSASSYDITFNYSYVSGNTDYGINNEYAGTTINAEDNWFGCNYGPGATGIGCDGLTNPISGAVDAAPWLVLDLAASPATIIENQTSDLTADLTWNSDGIDTSAGGHLPDGIATAFAASIGTVDPTITETVSGLAYSTFTHIADGTAVISATVDDQTVTTTITIEKEMVYLYLPLAMNGYTPMPDLQVTNITVDPTGGLSTGDPVTITVTVENVGNAAAGPFWIDLYDNPDPLPTAANQPWNALCSGPLTECYGIAWYVSGGLAPGESVTLGSLAGYETEQTHWLGTFVDEGTHNLYAFSDSWNLGVDYGAVEELNEGVDNRFGPFAVDIAASRSFTRPVEEEFTIPQRPNRP